MLSYEEFCDSVVYDLRNALPEEYKDAQIVLDEITKNNNQKLKCITAKLEEDRIAPVVYLDHYYKDYVIGKPYQQVVEGIAEAITVNRLQEDIFSVDKLLDYNYARARLFLNVCNYEMNMEFLKDVPHEVKGDYAITVRCMVSQDDAGSASFAIKNSHLDMYKVSKEQLFADAYLSAPNLEPSVFKSMAEVLRDMMPEGTVPEEEIPMYVLVNQSKNHGAACMFYPGVMEDISSKLGSDLHIIPSSVHEVIILTGDQKSEILSDMIQTVNETEVNPMEVLGTRPSTYDAINKEIIPMCEYEKHIKMIKNDIVRMGYRPTETIVTGIRKVEKLTGRKCELKDMAAVARSCGPTTDPELKETLNQIGKQLKLQEMQFPGLEP